MLDVIFVFLVAMFFGFVVTRTRSILGVTIAHGLTNVGLFIFFPLVLGR
jgi:membrane protease YdiL (CAAX protease family)